MMESPPSYVFNLNQLQNMEILKLYKFLALMIYLNQDLYKSQGSGWLVVEDLVIPW